MAAVGDGGSQRGREEGCAVIEEEGGKCCGGRQSRPRVDRGGGDDTFVW